MKRAFIIITIILMTIPLTFSQPPLSVSLNKTVFHPGDKLIIKVTTSPNIDVGVEIQNPKGGVSYVDQKRSDAQGIATFEVTLSPPSTWPPGTYTVKVSVTGNTATKTFKLVYIPPVGGVVLKVPPSKLLYDLIYSNIYIITIKLIVIVITLVIVLLLYLTVKRNKTSKSVA